MFNALCGAGKLPIEVRSPPWPWASPLPVRDPSRLNEGLWYLETAHY